MGKVLAVGLCLFVLAGCSGSGFNALKTEGGQATGVSTGRVIGGQQPVTGATIQLYAVGAAGDGSAATPLLTSPVTTDGSGNFSITGKYTCTTAGTQVYLVATGGNPGLAAGMNNPALSLMTALGSCGALSASTYLVVNEVTTVGSMAALNPYMSSYAAIGSGTSDAAQLVTAFTTVNEYTNEARGTTPGPTLPANYYASSTEINTLADIVSRCVNSAGGTANDGSACGNLFALAKPSAAAAPTDVIGAILDILNNPNSNVAGLLALTPAAGAPFQPTLSVAPTNWTLPIVQNNLVPAIGSLSPGYVLFGRTSNISAMVLGSNFVPSSTVQVNGSSRTTTYYSNYVPTALGFQLTPADVASSGTLTITVTNPAPGGGVSTPQNITVVPSTTPIVSSVSPNPFLAGSPATTISVYGYFLTAITQIQWNGTPLTTTATYIGSTLINLAALVPANLLATAGTENVTLYNSATTPTTSANFPVTISSPPAPTVSSISSTSGPINTSVQMAVSGTNFTLASSLTVNGIPVPTTVSSSTNLVADIPASSLTTPGNYNLGVTTAPPGGGSSAPLVYTAYVGLPNNSMLYNPVNGLLYVSVPGSAGAPYGNSIVSVDPATGALGTPIYVGSEPDKLALTADGTILWVGLDGAASVRQVNLTTNIAGLQFPVQGSSSNDSPPVAALAALSGAPNSVIVSANATAPVIYDNGVLRGSLGAACIGTQCANAMQVDGTKNEIYAATGNQYYVYSYNASGVTLKTTASSGNYSGDTFYTDTSEAFSYATNDEIQLLSGAIYTDFGRTYDAESGTLLDTFYNNHYYNGAYPAYGPSYADAALGKIYYLDTGSNKTYLYQQIQSFNLSNYTESSASVIPISVVSTTTGSANANPSRLLRWGSNGLAFRTARAIYSVRSNLVNDLSALNADIGVSVAASGGSATGATTTYIATVTNAGPTGATNVVFTAQPPSTGTVVSATASSGRCSTSRAIACDLGGLANGASSTVTVVVGQLSAGPSTLAAQVTGSENDPNTVNNQASATVTISGSTYTPAPMATSINPAAILSGSSDTTITVTGSGFTTASTVLVRGAPVPTSYVRATQLTAVIPATQLTSLGWSTVNVANPSPGGGASASLPLSIYSVIAAGANHILYDPYTRKVMASIGSGPDANSIAAVTPETATVGIVVPIGSQPSALALTPDGQILYASLTGSNSVARYNMLTQQPDFTVAMGATYNGSPINLGGIAVQPGTENSIALNLGPVGTAIYDFDPTTKTAAIRGQANDRSTASCPQFLDAGHLLTTSAYDGNSYSSMLLNSTVPTGGFAFGTSNATSSNLNGFVCVMVSGGLAYGSGGVIANPSTAPATMIGTFPQDLNWTSSDYDSIQNGIPDTSLQRSFFIATIAPPCSPCNSPGGITAYSQSSFLLTDVVDLKMQSFEGNYSYTSVDLVRWGQDGLAGLTSSGRIYLLRGPAVVPELLSQNGPATLTSSSATTIAHGSGNTLLTLTGGNFVPGVAVTWNGSYRTTTIVDSTHLTVAIPASDLGPLGTATVVATNPGATSSSALTITIN